MTLDIIHEGGGCEAVYKESRSLRRDDHGVHRWLCKNKATHLAVYESGEEKKCCAEHGARWLESGFLVDLVPL